MPIFKIDLDDFCEEVFHELENLSAGGRGHEFKIEGDNDMDAAQRVAFLLIPFLADKLEESEAD